MPRVLREHQVHAMQTLLEDVIQGLGWLTLKALTAGRYQPRAPDARLFEGTVGFVILVAVTVAAYAWWPE
jgi:hypothetical protein